VQRPLKAVKHLLAAFKFITEHTAYDPVFFHHFYAVIVPDVVEKSKVPGLHFSQ
jgi:hypothetical protein